MLMRAMDMDLKHVPDIIYTCFILHNFCELRNIPVYVQNVKIKERGDQNCDHHVNMDNMYPITPLKVAPHLRAHAPLSG